MMPAHLKKGLDGDRARRQLAQELLAGNDAGVKASLADLRKKLPDGFDSRAESDSEDDHRRKAVPSNVSSSKKLLSKQPTAAVLDDSPVRPSQKEPRVKMHATVKVKETRKVNASLHGSSSTPVLPDIPSAKPRKFVKKGERLAHRDCFAV